MDSECFPCAEEYMICQASFGKDTFRLREGFMASIDEPSQVYRCGFIDGCKGVRDPFNRSQNPCTGNHAGATCTRCEENYAARGVECTSCLAEGEGAVGLPAWPYPFDCLVGPGQLKGPVYGLPGYRVRPWAAVNHGLERPVYHAVNHGMAGLVPAGPAWLARPGRPAGQPDRPNGLAGPPGRPDWPARLAGRTGWAGRTGQPARDRPRARLPGCGGGPV